MPATLVGLLYHLSMTIYPKHDYVCLSSCKVMQGYFNFHLDFICSSG